MPELKRWTMLSSMLLILANPIDAKESQGSFGVAFGPEYFVLNVLPPPTASIDFFFPGSDFLYYGPDANIHLLVAVWGHLGFHSGIDLGFVFLEASASGTFGLSPTPGTSDFGWLSLNPKVGLRVFDVYAKTGPSFILGGTPASHKNSFVTFLGFPCNFEVGYTFPQKQE